MDESLNGRIVVGEHLSKCAEGITCTYPNSLYGAYQIWLNQEALPIIRELQMALEEMEERYDDCRGRISG